VGDALVAERWRFRRIGSFWLLRHEVVGLLDEHFRYI
jgi:hypothetical protein